MTRSPRHRTRRKRLFLSDFPALAAQFHPTKNPKLALDQIAAFSGQGFWWKCKKGPDHVWEATPNNRQRRGCPFCSGRRPSKANNLATRAPRVAAEWHPSRNAPVSPRDVTFGSNRKYWWRCRRDHDHEWLTKVNSRTQPGGTGCPFCARSRLTSVNNLAKRFPGVARLWHPRKNGDLRPKDVIALSHMRVWWKCNRGPDHEWAARIKLRVLGRGCPFCAGRRASTTNSLASLYPALAAQWHPTRNGRLTAADVSFGSTKKAWWRCDAAPDHQWRTTIASRRERGCPFCAHRRASSTYSLALLRPAVARQWHSTRNGGLRPSDVTPGSRKRVWWRCVSGHSWQCEISLRTRTRATGCPGCRLRRRRPATKRIGERVLLPSDFS